MTRSVLLTALLTGAFCAVFAVFVSYVTSLFAIFGVIGISFISGFLGSVFAQGVLKRVEHPGTSDQGEKT